MYSEIFFDMNKLMIYLLITFLGMTFSLSAQTERKISVEYNQEPLSSALVELQKASGYKFIFTYEDVEGFYVTVSENNKTVNEIMPLFLNNTSLTYKIEGEYVSILPRSKQTQTQRNDRLQREVSGTVTDEMNEPLPGAAVYVVGAQIGTVTDINGDFTIMVPNENSFLEVAFIGMETATVPTAQMDVINVTLTESARVLDELVVTGYQTLSLERSTGSFAKIDAEDLEIKRIDNLGSVLEGQFAGYVDGHIRGVTSMNSPTSPLVVIDGFPVENSSINRIGEFQESLPDMNPEDIESITILKDAAAASIYGARAANGVIVITTKKAKQGRTDISFSSTLTFQPYSHYVDNLTNAADVIQMQRDWASTSNLMQGGDVASQVAARIRDEGRYSRGVDILMDMYTNNISMDEGNRILDNLAGMGYHYYDQVVEYAKRNPFYQQYNLRVAKASDRNSFNFSTSYWDNKHADINSKDSRIGINITNSMKVTDWLTFDVGVYFKHGQSTNQSFNMYSPGFSVMPYDGLVAADGSNISAITQNTSNRNDLIDEYGLYDETITPMDELNYGLSETRSFEARTYANIKLDFTSWLNYNVMFQNERSENVSESFSEIQSHGMRSLVNNFTTGSPGNLIYNLPNGERLFTLNDLASAYVFRHQLNLNKTYNDKHEFAWIGGQEVRRRLIKHQGDTYYGYDPQTLTRGTYNEQELSNYFYGILGYAPFNPDNGRFMLEDLDRFVSFYSNASYTFDRRYVLSGSIRWDRSNLWATGSKYQNKPIWSTGFSWNIDREDFFSSDVVDMLKFRATHGIGGNIGDSTSPYLIASYFTSYQFGGLAGIVQTPPNADLRWEKTTTTNIGFDFALFRNRLSGSLDYYNKYSSDLLADTPLSATQGFGYNTMLVNNGEMVNRGFELALRGDVIRNKDFSWNATLLYALNNNEVKKLQSTTESANMLINFPTTYAQIGKPLYGLYAFRWAGLNEHGDPQIYNEEGDPVSNRVDTSKEMYYAGTSIPVQSGTFTNILRYKDFEFSAMLTFALGHKLRGRDVPTISMTEGRINSTYNSINDRWRNPGDEATTDVPRLLFSNQTDEYNTYRNTLYSYSDLFIYDASNIRIRNISFAYRVPQRIVERMSLSSARLQFNIENLSTFAFDSKARYNLGAYNKPNYVWGLYLNF